MTDTATDTDHALLLRLEAERCQALKDKDLAALERILSPRLVHIHASGAIDDHQGYLAMVAEKLDFLEIARSDLDVTIHDGAAVMVGTLRQTVRVRATGQEIDMASIVSQLWVGGGGTWRQASFHAAPAKPA